MPTFELPKVLHPDFQLPQRKPVGPVEIDWLNPITRGLKFLYVADGFEIFKDLVTGDIGIVGGVRPLPKVNRNGERVVAVTVAGATSVSFLNVQVSVGAGAVSFAAGWEWDGIGQGFRTVVSLPGVADLGVYAPTSNVDHRIAQDSSAGNTVEFSGAKMVAVEPTTIGITRRDTTNTAGTQFAYHDGIEASANTEQAQAYGGGNGFGVLLFVGQNTEFSGGSMSWCGVWNTQLSAAQNLSLHNNPWQMLKPKIPVFYFTPEAEAEGALLSIGSSLTGGHNRTHGGMLT